MNTTSILTYYLNNVGKQLIQELNNKGQLNKTYLGLTKNMVTKYGGSLYLPTYQACAKTPERERERFPHKPKSHWINNPIYRTFPQAQQGNIKINKWNSTNTISPHLAKYKTKTKTPIWPRNNSNKDTKPYPKSSSSKLTPYSPQITPPPTTQPQASHTPTLLLLTTH